MAEAVVLALTAALLVAGGAAAVAVSAISRAQDRARRDLARSRRLAAAEVREAADRAAHARRMRQIARARTEDDLGAGTQEPS